jgi:hypothetical protein
MQGYDEEQERLAKLVMSVTSKHLLEMGLVIHLGLDRKNCKGEVTVHYIHSEGNLDIQGK